MSESENDPSYKSHFFSRLKGTVPCRTGCVPVIRGFAEWSQMDLRVSGVEVPLSNCNSVALN